MSTELFETASSRALSGSRRAAFFSFNLSNDTDMV